MVLGVHCPVSGGFDAALRQARALGCEAMQLFPYKRHEMHSAAELAGFRSSRESSGVRRLLAHSRFAPCLASRSGQRRRRSIELLDRELRLAAALGAEALILHAGAYSEESDRGEGLRLAAAAVGEAWDRACGGGSGLPVLFENVPGGGRRLGAALHDLAELLGPLRRAGKPCGVCVDTAHAWAAGFDLASAEGMLRFLSRLHRVVGAESVLAFHLNDTRALLGSQRESHVPWGEGFLGAEGLRVLLARPEYADRPAIVELPLAADLDAALASLTYVRGLSRRI
ncbi:MAG: deoxyribonuclease IV [Elusimicrobia bacterium]|nr:deoxyribonuclease IV [Elusimicrobiota bacterium]